MAPVAGRRRGRYIFAGGTDADCRYRIEPSEGSELDLCDALRMEAEGIWDPVRDEWKV